MNAEMRRARILACALDLLLSVAIADGFGLLATGVAWFFWVGGRPQTAWLWVSVAASSVLGFLLRDARGGRARKWLSLEVRNARGGPPGSWQSIRRNLPLLVPGWNLVDFWPVLRDGGAARRSDRWQGTLVVAGD